MPAQPVPGPPIEPIMCGDHPCAPGEIPAVTDLIESKIFQILLLIVVGHYVYTKFLKKG